MPADDLAYVTRPSVAVIYTMLILQVLFISDGELYEPASKQCQGMTVQCRYNAVNFL